MISVIIPVYNAGSALPKQLSCLREQTETCFEVLLINDGSTDDSGRICDDIAKTDARFKCIHQQNAGVSAARNAGLNAAKGNYITFLDADDVIDPNYLFALRHTAEQTNADIVVCDVAVMENNIETLRFSAANEIMSQTTALNLLLTRKKINSGPCAKLFKRSILQNLFFPPLKVYEDMLFVQQAFEHAHTIASTQQTAYYYIQNSSGAMSKNKKLPSLDIITAAQRTIQFIGNHKELHPETFYVTFSHVMQYAMDLIAHAERKAALPFLQAFQKLCAQHRMRILRCQAFPAKEKAVYIAYSFGFLYHDKHLTRWSD